MSTVVFLVWVSVATGNPGLAEMPSLQACETVGKWWDGAQKSPKVKWTCMELPR